MTASSASSSFRTVLLRDIRRQLAAPAQLVLFALMAVIAVLVIVAPGIVSAASSSAPRVYAVAPSDVVRIVAAEQPGWEVIGVDAVPGDLRGDVAVVVAESGVEVHVEKASQVAGARTVGDIFAGAALSAASGIATPPIAFRAAADDGSAVVTRLITLVSALLVFSVITGRASWAYGALSRDLSLGLFDAVLARASAAGLLGGRIVAAAVSGVVQLITLGAVAAGTLTVIGESEVAGRVVELALPLSLWAGAGVALFTSLAVVCVLLFRGNAASLGILIQLVGFASFGILMVALLDPGAGWISVASLIPPVSVLLLPVRMAEGLAAATDPAVAGGVMVVATIALFWLALRVWRAATMTDGLGPMWRAVLARRPSATRHDRPDTDAHTAADETPGLRPRTPV